MVFDVSPGGAGLDVCKISACMVAGAAPGPGHEEVCCFFSELIIEKGLEEVSDEVWSCNGEDCNTEDCKSCGVSCIRLDNAVSFGSSRRTPKGWDKTLVKFSWLFVRQWSGLTGIDAEFCVHPEWPCELGWFVAWQWEGDERWFTDCVLEPFAEFFL